jgi:flavin reductase (DIM6/NTAB) family NADH-FMN oxidoreductase RutF
MDKNIFRDITYGMYVVTTQNAGCIINTMTQITSENPIISISINKNNYTNEKLKEERNFAVSIISEQTNPNLISVFGFQTSKEKNKFENFDYEEINNIKVLKEETTGYLICEVIDIVDCETHDIFLGRVIDAKKLNDNKPMTYKYYHEVVKGKAPKNAPTYIEEKVERKVKEKQDEFISSEPELDDVTPYHASRDSSVIKKFYDE